MEYELVPGVLGTPFFTSREAEEAFRKRFSETMKPYLDEMACRRAASELEARSHLVD